MIRSFHDRVLSVVKRIPCGATISYQEVARRAGNPHAYRAVGNILTKNYDRTVPCHRVIRSDGTVGGYNRGSRRKRERLEREGVSLLS